MRISQETKPAIATTPVEEKSMPKESPRQETPKETVPEAVPIPTRIVGETGLTASPSILEVTEEIPSKQMTIQDPCPKSQTNTIKAEEKMRSESVQPTSSRYDECDFAT